MMMNSSIYTRQRRKRVKVSSAERGYPLTAANSVRSIRTESSSEHQRSWVFSLIEGNKARVGEFVSQGLLAP
jgi:hypothetical protein